MNISEEKFLCHNHSEIAVEKFDDGPVIINFLTGRYFSLDAWGELVWQYFSGGLNQIQLEEHILNLPLISELEKAQVKIDVERFVATLIEQRLLAPLSGSPTHGVGDINLLIPEVYSPPKIEVYDDLADLILIDPIHDVNESLGWPVAQSPNDQK